MFGPRDFPVLRLEIISDISNGTEGRIKTQFPILPPMKSIGNLLVLGIVLVTFDHLQDCI